jgi:hypothetical protein
MLNSLSADVSYSRDFLACRDRLGKRRIIHGMRQYRMAHLRGPRHCERSEAIHLAVSKILDCFVAAAPRNDVETHLLLPATHHVRVLPHHVPRKSRGRRECRVHPMHPQPRVRIKKAHELKSPQVHRNDPAFPARVVLTACFVLSPVIGLSCHRHLQNHHLANLTPASRRQDHTTSPSAQAHSSRARKRPSHPAPNVRDDREAPLLAGAGQARTCP